jgi:transcriptional regulator with XRE-family HTH domain
MSLKTAFAAALKVMRANRGLSQKKLAEVSSRTYISKLERGQCSPTLEMITALSAPLGLHPLTLIAITVSAESGQPITALLNQAGKEISDLASAGVLQALQIPFSTGALGSQNRSRSESGSSMMASQQTELCFAE